MGNPNSGAYGAGFVFGAILLAAFVTGMWLWMAWAVRRGKNRARIVSAVLFGLGPGGQPYPDQYGYQPPPEGPPAQPPWLHGGR